MFLIDDLRKLATDAGHAIDGEVHKFLTFVEDKIAAVTPHVSFGRPDPVQPRAAAPTVVVTRASIVVPPPVAEPIAELVAEPIAEPVAEPIAEPVAEPIAEPVAEPIAEPIAEPVAEPIAEPVAEPIAVETPNEDHPGP